MSKSVMESASAASTGRKKNTPMTPSAGATNHHAARLRLTEGPPRLQRSRATSAGEYPATFLEDSIGACIELGGGLVDRHLSMHGPFGDQPQLVGDALPFRHLGRGLHALELVAEGAGVHIVGDAPLDPGRASRRQIPGQRVKA